MALKAKVLLFDLGGVIVPWVGIEELGKLISKSRDEIIALAASSDVFNAYETGRCSEDEFLPEMLRVFNLDMSEDAFAKLWNSWVKAPYPGTFEKLDELRAAYQVACLSNTNNLHWEYIKDQFDLPNQFSPAIASHEIHLAKPNPACFEKTAELLGVAPKDIIFFDDTQINVDAANAAGMTAYKVDPKVGVLPLLKELGL